MNIYKAVKRKIFSLLYQIKIIINQDYNLNTSNRTEKIIISLTSYPKRFHAVYYAIRSIMLQSVKPDKIVLYLDSNVSEDMLPKRLKALQAKGGVEIKITSTNIKPHKKYFHAMQEYPDSIIITIDDDVMYEKDTIKNLYETYLKYPCAVAAKRVSKMTKNKIGELNPYIEWKGEYTQELKPIDSLLATGVGGVLYPPHCFDERAFDINKITEFCLNQDDIWLKYMEILCERKVVYAVGKMSHPYSIHVRDGLYLNNVHMNQNDMAIKNMKKAYGIDLADYIEN